MKSVPAGVVFVAFLGLVVGSLAAEEEDRLPIPAAADVTAAEATVRDIFKEEYAKPKAADRAALAAKLLAQAEETNDDDVSKYVLLREARDVAAKAGDAATAMRAATAMSDEFKIGSGAALAAVADALVLSTIGPNPSRVLADQLMAVAGEAKSEGDVKSLVVLLKAAEAAARKGQNPQLATALRVKIKEAETLKADADAVDRHLVTLEKMPDDPAANLAVGRYLCQVRGDWKGGVPLLAKGGDAKLKEVAAKDIAAEADATAQLAAGDAWYDYAAADSAFKSAAQGRAYHWYQLAAPTLAGLSKIKIETRLKELQTVASEAGGSTARFATIRKALTEKVIKKWQIVGGAFTRTTYEELPPEGAILIGFNYTTVENGRYPGVVQAIYLTQRGEVKGQIFGKPGPGEMGQTTKAKPGYAVGAIYTRGGGGFDAFKPIYMRMTDKGLDPKDSYDGPHIGGQGGGDGTLGGDGQFIIGIHGKVDTTKAHMESLSPITIAAPAAATNSNDPPTKRPRPPTKKPRPLPKKGS